MEFMRPGHMLRRNMFTKGRGGHCRGVDSHGGRRGSAALQRGSTASNPASCREAANGLISLLDAGKDDGALYRHTYAVVVTTCGPASPTPRPAAPPSPVGRAQCSGLAAAMVDLIEDDKMEFGRVCPRPRGLRGRLYTKVNCGRRMEAFSGKVATGFPKKMRPNL